MGTAGLRGPGRNMPHSAHTTAVNIPGFDLMFYTEKKIVQNGMLNGMCLLSCARCRADRRHLTVRPPERRSFGAERGVRARCGPLTCWRYTALDMRGSTVERNRVQARFT